MLLPTLQMIVLERGAAPSDDPSGVSARVTDRLQIVSRIYEELAQSPQALRHYVVYPLVDFVVQAQLNRGLYERARRPLLPGLFSLLDTCTDSETQQIFAVLDTTGRVAFKRMHDEYKDRHKYKGDV